ncbi:BnaC04g15650D [Brassica napus]|uniref:(rape) hypothetical protein n=1 Tax=Brassica napus TaxID=3708 RepID=A0A078FS75_BRANA|nr:unnamed protein product [Brassica napus]CDY15759.1 BnaC04g15650D [Brassica napus]
MEIQRRGQNPKPDDVVVAIAMSTRQSIRTKSKTGDPVNGELENNGLPVRLFATDRYPFERVNMYSILWVRAVLRGSPEMDILMGSCFAGLFQIPTRRLLAGKVVHCMMTRQIVTKKKYEMWHVFGGNPFRFSLFWDRLIGDSRDATIEYIVALVESDDEMPRDIRLKLCLIVIVDGVLVAKSQKPWPTLKYLKLLEMMGKCEDPVGVFCNKLRQQMIKTGFPLALQLVAFWTIPQLLQLVSGDDTITLLNYPEMSLPQHSGLIVAAVRKAEHNSVVRPMMVASGNHEDMWGLWDDENFDRRVNYMLELIEGGHVFTKAEWLGGAGDPLFLYGAKARTPKRKKQLDSDEEPASKKSRVGGHNTRSVSEGADGEKFRELEARVDEVVADVALLREGERAEICGTSVHIPGGGHHDIAVEDAGTGVIGSGGSGGTKPAGPGPQEIDKCASGVEGLNQDSIGGSDVPAAEGINPVEQDCLDLLVGAVMKDAGLTTDDCANEHPVVEESHEDTVASRLAAGEIAKVSLADKSESADGTDAEAMNKTICMSMIGSGDNLMDEECPLVINETLGAEDGVQTASEADFTTATVDEPVVGGVAGNVADVCVLDDKSESAAETAAEAINKVADHVHVDEIGLGDDLMDEECPPVISETMGPEGGVQKESAEYMTPAFGEESILEGLEGNDPDAGVHVVDPGHGDVIGSHDDMTDGETEQKEGETGVMILSDSPTPMTARHIPVAEEEELASLLLAKSYYDLADMVPVIEDRDYPFFERVLQSNPQVMHHNAGGGVRDLDNVLFLELATPRKWVNSMHMKVLMEYSERQYGLELHLNRAMFLAPLFTAHMQGKRRSFRAAKRKTCIVGDAKITKYLTQKCKRWGVEVNSLYTPMI